MLTQSPKVIVTEIDLSSTIEAASELSVALVGQARRGKAFERVLIANDRQLIDQFGKTKEGYYLCYGALNYFKYGKKAWCTRVVPEDSKCAVLMGDSVGAVTNIPGIKTPEAIQNINEVEDSPLVIGGTQFELDYSSLYTYFTPGSIRLSVNAIAFVDDGTGFVETATGDKLWMNYLDGKMWVEMAVALDPGDAFTLTATYSDFNHFDEYLAGIQQVAFVGDGSSNYSATLQTEIVPGSLELIQGTNIVAADDGNGNITGTGVVSAGSTINYTTGVLSVETSSPVTSGTPVYTGYVYQRLASTLVHAAVTGPGIYGTTEFKLLLVNKTDYPSSGFYFNDYPRENDEFLVILKDILENQISESHVVSRDSDSKNIDGTSRFAGDIFANPGHLFIVVDSTESTLTTEIGTFEDGTGDIDYKYFVGGTEGDLPITDADFVEGFKLYEDKQQISVAVIPSLGVTSPAVQNYLISMVEARRSVALLDTPFLADTSTESVEYRRGELTGFIGFNPNTSYAGLYGGWRQIKDWYNDKVVWVPWTASILANFAKVFYYEEAWDAVAGTRKGVINNTLTLLFNPKEGERDHMYANQVNPVYSAPGKGTRMWGQKTLQSYYSALSFLNTRFLLNILNEAMGEYAETALFERNTQSTRSKIRMDLEAYLDNIRRRGGVDKYKVICDESNNPGFIIDQRGMIIDVYIIPTADVESIKLNTIILNRSAKFEEIIIKTSEIPS